MELYNNNLKVEETDFLDLSNEELIDILLNDPDLMKEIEDGELQERKRTKIKMEKGFIDIGVSSQFNRI